MSDAAEIEELRASFREVLEDSAANGEIRRHVDEGAARCEPLWAKAAELGWFALLTPEAHGGLGLDRAAAATLYQELGRVAAPLPIAASLAATEIIAAFADTTQQSQWLPRLAAGEVATFSADDRSPDWTGVRLSGGSLTGDVRDLLDGDQAALLLAPARDGSAVPWVLADTANFTLQRIALVDRTRSLARARMESVQASALPSAPEPVARMLRIHTGIAVACDSVGGAKAVLELTVGYLKTREQFGKPIGAFQALKHRCAEHKVAIDAADALLAEAVERWSADDGEAELYTALVKPLACDTYAAVATDAVQLHGGIGFTWEHVCHLYLKRAKLNQALFGGSAAHRDAAARLLVA